MDKIIMIVGLFSAFGIVILLGFFPDMSSKDKLPIITILMLIAIIVLSRIKSEDTKSGKDTGK
jgi:hypothetical protein